MKLITDKTGTIAGFDEWFDSKDVPKIIKAIEEIGYEIQTEQADYEFKYLPILRKKDRYEPVPRTAKNIVIMLTNADKPDDIILKMLGIERESTFVITPMIRKLQGEYVKWQKIDHNKEYQNDIERIKAFARYVETVSKKFFDKGTKVTIKDGKVKGIITEYDKKKRKYFIETKDSGMYYDKDEFEVTI